MIEQYVEFIAMRNNVKIEGFINLNEIDDDESIQYYTIQGFENGYNIPSNPYNQDTEIGNWNEYENLKTYLTQDDMFLQFLWDFQKEYYTIKRPGYILVINPDLQE